MAHHSQNVKQQGAACNRIAMMQLHAACLVAHVCRMLLFCSKIWHCGSMFGSQHVTIAVLLHGQRVQSILLSAQKLASSEVPLVNQVSNFVMNGQCQAAQAPDVAGKQT